MNTRLRIIIPGGNGQVGTVLSRHFHAQEHEVVVLARKSVPAPWRVVSWDGENLGQWTSELENSDVVINLAGKSVNCRYTAANRKASTGGMASSASREMAGSGDAVKG